MEHLGHRRTKDIDREGKKAASLDFSELTGKQYLAIFGAGW